jgi:hypothetical protein
VREQNEYIREYNSYNNGYNGFVRNEIDIRTEPIKEWIKNVSYEPKKHTCKICNTDISLSSKSRHEKTDKHKYNIINKIVDKKTKITIEILEQCLNEFNLYFCYFYCKVLKILA